MDTKTKGILVALIVMVVCMMCSSGVVVAGSQTQWFGLVGTDEKTTVTTGAAGGTTGTNSTTAAGATKSTTAAGGTTTTSGAVTQDATTAAATLPAIPWISHLGFDSAGNDLRDMSTDSADACARACSGDPACKYFITNGTGTHCWLKKDFNQTTYAAADRNLWLAPGQAFNPIMTVWTDASYKGTSHWFYPGKYYYTAAWDIPNDSISSLKIPAGFKVRLWDNAGFGGASIELAAGDYPDLKQQGWNDKASSFEYYAS